MEKLYYYLSLAIVCLLPSSPLTALTIEGQVLDKGTKEVLIGALIQLEGTTAHTLTDIQGRFQLTTDQIGQVRINVSYLGYANQNLTTTSSGAQTTSKVLVELEPQQIELPMVKVLPNFSNDLLVKIDQDLRPVSSSQEFLQLVPGLYIAQHAGGGKAEQLFLRGFDLDHGTDLALQVDGMPVNMVSHAHGQGYADLHFLMPEMIEQIRYQKGPYAVDAGNLATAGAIQFQTPNRIARNQVKAEVGQYGWGRVAGQIKLLDQKDQHWYATAAGNYSRGYFESPQDLQATHFFSKYTHILADDQRLTLSLGHFTSNWNASGQIPQRAVEQELITRFGAIDDTEGGNTSRTNLNIQLQTPFENGALLKNQIWAGHYDFLLYSNFTFFANHPLVGDQIRQRENRWLAGSNNSLTLPYRLFGGQADTEFGLQYRQDWVQDVELSYTQNREEITERLALGNIQEQNLGLYIQQNWQPITRLHILLGARFDQFSFRYTDRLETVSSPRKITKSIVSPKLALTYSVCESLNIFAKAGKGFHSNDTRVVVQQQGVDILPAAYGWDAGTQFKPHPNFLVQAAYWQLWSEQEFVYVGDEAVIESGAPSFRQGVDLSTRAQLSRMLFLDADLTYAKARSLGVDPEESSIPLAPIITCSGGLSLQLQNGIEGSFRFRHLSDRPANEDYSLTAEGYWIEDLLVGYTVENLRFQVFIQNLLNVEWAETQFETTSRLYGESTPITEIHYTPGTP
ncbi:MAG: TonB-dependent receptor, partial [Phaeodactylibacter sp.]|nr:TonB-dependent receptor [Phaeodactylibacter sp.]